MHGETTFHFIDGRDRGGARAGVDAADGDDVILGGGASTIHQLLIDLEEDEPAWLCLVGGLRADAVT